MNGIECFTFKKLVLHWIKIMLTERKDSICINKARHKIDYMEWFQLKHNWDQSFKNMKITFYIY